MIEKRIPRNYEKHIFFDWDYRRTNCKIKHGADNPSCYKVEGIDFDRCHFASFGDFSLNFELVYYVNSDDYAEYMDKNQDVNLEIFKEFEKQAIGFAYPTQTVFLNK